MHLIVFGTVCDSCVKLDAEEISAILKSRS